MQQPECKPTIIRVRFGCNGISCTDDSLLHTLPGTVPHVAFKVSCLDEATVGEAVIPGPYEANDDYRVAFDDGGVLVELIETTLSDEERSIRAGESVVEIQKCARVKITMDDGYFIQ